MSKIDEYIDRVKPHVDAFFNFDKSITPILLQVVFSLGVFASILYGIFGVGDWHKQYQGIVWTNVFASAFFVLLVPLLLRIGCELSIAVFKIQGYLYEIKKSNQTNKD